MVQLFRNAVVSMLVLKLIPAEEVRRHLDLELRAEPPGNGDVVAEDGFGAEPPGNEDVVAGDGDARALTDESYHLQPHLPVLLWYGGVV